VARAVLPHAAVLVPLLGAQTLETNAAGLLVELAAGKGAAGGRDRLQLVTGGAPLRFG
jgi:hypothetical protein